MLLFRMAKSEPYCGGSHMVSSHGMCYHLKEGTANWDQAHAFCQEKNMEMASMETEEEFDGYMEIFDMLGG